MTLTQDYIIELAKSKKIHFENCLTSSFVPYVMNKYVCISKQGSVKGIADYNIDCTPFLRMPFQLFIDCFKQETGAWIKTTSAEHTVSTLRKKGGHFHSVPMIMLYSTLL